MSGAFHVYINPASPGFEEIDRLIEKLDDRSGVMKSIGEALLATTQDRFASQTTPDGAAWPALSPATVAKRGAAGPILRQSGRLYGSLNYQVSGDTVRLGPNTIYAAVHNFGYTFSTGVTVPARTYVGFGPDDQRAVRDTIEEWLERL